MNVTVKPVAGEHKTFLITIPENDRGSFSEYLNTNDGIRSIYSDPAGLEIAVKNVAVGRDLVNIYYGWKKQLAARENAAKHAPRRAVVRAGIYSVGDEYNGFIVTNVGREFLPSEDFWSTHKRPVDGTDDDTTRWQYIYFT